LILFGVRSPIAVEYEESCHRCGIEITAAVSVNGVPRVLGSDRVVEWDAFRLAPRSDVFIACAFSPLRRRELAGLAEEAGLAMSPALIDPTAILARSVRVGRGSFVNAGVIIGAVSLIGSNVLVNRAASIGHHAIIGDNVSIGPGVMMAGNIHVGEGAIIGAGARVMPDIRIGRGAVVAGGALVRRHVPDGAFVDGHPAEERPFRLSRSSLHVAGGE
jgi:sugar O-acyltransferase (sialic acid O-acetyltransferase NeuD family)